MEQATIGNRKKVSINMTINGSRQFKGNDGKNYMIRNACSSDSDKGKYNLAVKINGIYRLCYNMFFQLMFFNTIKDAQREVLYSADFIRTMNDF